MIKGIVLFFNIDRQYGFIENSKGGSDIFIHKSGIVDETYWPKSGDIVTFDIENTDNGKTRAKNVKKINGE